MAGPNGTFNFGGLVEGTDGNFYGTTESGGTAGQGTIFKLTPDGVETVLYNFADNSLPYLGVFPSGGLLLASDGNFYGTTYGTDSSAGLNIGLGAIYRMTPQGVVTFLHNFSDGSSLYDGDSPITTLIQGSDGGLYGMTSNGGRVPSDFYNGFSPYSGAGTVFKLTLGVPALTSPLTATGSAGNPFSYQITGTNTPTRFAAAASLPAGLSLDPATGLISGTPTTSGTTVVTLTLVNSTGSSQTPLTLNFSALPVPALTSGLNIFGTINQALSYTLTATNSPTSYSISTPPAGLAGLSMDPTTGILSGIPATAGTYQISLIAANASGLGFKTLTIQIFSTPPSLAQEYSVIHRFQSGSDGAGPNSPLIQGMDGTFYGVTASGGPGSDGAAFNLNSQGATTILHTAGNTFADDMTPRGIILGSDGNYYGTTTGGGWAGKGTIFKITPAGVQTILHNFDDGTVANDGTVPMAGLVQGSDGNFYGTTSAGGTNSAGTVFVISPQADFAILYDFGTVAHDGANPSATLIQGADGLLYGTTAAGGTAGQGTIFSVSTAGSLTILHNFADGGVTNDGKGPIASLVQDSTGNFYGTTPTGGSQNLGTLFQMTGGVVTILHHFGDGSVLNDGTCPQGAVIEAFDGNLYGTTKTGGSAGLGTVFQYNLLGAQAGTAAILHNFGDGTLQQDGASPLAALLQGTDGNFYGTASAGGTGNGVVFTIQTNQTPVVPPVIVGATTMFNAAQNPLVFGLQALQLPATTGSVQSSAIAFHKNAVQPKWVLTGATPPNLAFNTNTGLLSGRTSSTSGIYTYSVLAQNGAAQSRQTAVTVCVEKLPTLSSAATVTATEGTAFNYQIAVGAKDFPLRYGATGLPHWLTIDPDTGTISGTPPGPGLYTFGATSTNLAGTTTLKVKLTVQGLSAAEPAITSATTASGTCGDPFTYQVTATSNPASTYSYAALTLPPGLLFNKATGLISGRPRTPGTFTVPISATNAAGTGASVVTVTFVPLLNQTIGAFAKIPSQGFGSTFAITLPTATSGLSVTVTVASGPATLSGNMVTVTGLGTVTLAASQPGNATYNPAKQVTTSFTTVKGNQTIAAFTPIPDQTYGVAPFAITFPTASSGLAVKVVVDSGPAKLSGHTITITGGGTVVLVATQAGNPHDYYSAPAVTTSFQVSKIAQSITAFTAIPDKTFGAAPFAIKLPTASSGLAVTVTVKSGPATITGSKTITLTGAGAVVLEADQAGNTHYAAAAPVTTSFVVSKASQAIDFPALVPGLVGKTITLPATAASGLPIIYSIVPASGYTGTATITGSKITFTGAGKIKLAADQPGNANYLAATQIRQNVQITGTQAITFPAVSLGTVGKSVTLTATSTSGLPITYSVVPTSGYAGTATISGSKLTFTGTGKIKLAADQPGNANYLAATQVRQIVTIAATP